MSGRLNAAILSYAQVAIRIATTLVFTPILVRSLGQDGYGLFSIVGALAAYFYMIDFGLNDSVMRFFVGHEKVPEQRQRFLAETLGFYALLGGLVVVATLAFYGMIPRIFASGLATPQIVLLQQMTLIVGAGAAVLVAFNPLGALISASERFVFLRTTEIVAALASTLLLVVLLWSGFGALMVVTVMSGTTMVQVAVRMVYVVRVLGVPVGWARPNRTRLKPVAYYAAPIFISMLVEQIYWKLDSLIIGALVGAAPVAVYAIGTTFNKYLMNFGTAISRILAPEIIRQADSGADGTALTGLLIRVSRLQALFLLLVVTGLFLFGARFIRLWLGPEYDLSYVIMLIVLIPYTLELVGNTRNILLQVKGLYWHRSLIILAIAILNIPLTVVLMKMYGVVGAAASTAVGLVAGYACVAVLLQIKLRMDMAHYFLGLARGIVPVVLVCLIAGRALDQFVFHGWAGLMVCIVAYTATYAGLMLKFGMNAYERGLALRVVGRIVPALTRRPSS